MVHNGIEYGDMQVIAEAYDLMRRGLEMAPAEIAEVFAGWNRGRLRSYLIEITAEILAAEEEGTPMVDLILDAAGQKGTGKWTVIASMDLAEPTALVAEAVYARIVSSDPDRRRELSAVFDTPLGDLAGVTLEDIEAALYASKIVSYTQGFRLMRAASEENGWGLDPGGVASLWRAGCIIRAAFLEDITAAYDGWCQGPPPRGSRFPPIPAHWPISTECAQVGCPPTSSRPSGTSSGPTPSSGSTDRGARRSIGSGSARSGRLASLAALGTW
jgi:6-phosphogluconate dehydrogenase